MIKTGTDSDYDELTIADVALTYPHATKVLSQYQIDYCCDGDSLFAEACRTLSYEPNAIWAEIQRELPMPSFGMRFDFKSWNTDMLIDFIRQNHHEYIRLTIPEIKSLLEIICTVHADDEKLSAIRSYFISLGEDLLHEMPVEEDVLFPAIKRISRSILTVENDVLMGRIRRTVDRIQQRHRQARELIKQIRSTADNFRVPPYACPTYQMTFRMLEEFEQDLIQHFHLENNVLFLKVKTIEKGLEII